MKKIIILVGVFLCLSEVSFAVSQNSAKLSAVESQLFGIEYKAETDFARLKRIEGYLYGKVYSNDINTRVQKICTDIGVVDSAQKLADAKGQSSSYYQKEDSSVQYPIIDSIESKVFNKTFKNEKVYARLDRLENKIYGKISQSDLNNRVNNLRLAVLDTIPTDSSTTFDSLSELHNIPSSQSDFSDNLAYDDSYNYVSPQKSKNDYLKNELTAIEQVVLKKSYSADSQDARLDRLENKLFKRNFQTDSTAMRVERIAAATSAKKSSQMYDNNKLMRNLTTGAQIGGILLMILAMIL